MCDSAEFRNCNGLNSLCYSCQPGDGGNRRPSPLYIYLRPKDPVPPDNRTGVVNRIPCMCCSQSYIGQTGRTLTCRLKEHRQAVSQGDFNASALAEHAVNTGHQIDWSNTGVLDSSQFYYQRLYLESWYIH